MTSSSPAASPFDDIRRLAADAPAAPTPSFEGGDRLAEISAWLTDWTGKTPPAVLRPAQARSGPAESAETWR